MKIFLKKVQKEREREKRTNELSFNITKDKGHLYSFQNFKTLHTVFDLGS